jgi:hypothetical protein
VFQQFAAIRQSPAVFHRLSERGIVLEYAVYGFFNHVHRISAGAGGGFS